MSTYSRGLKPLAISTVVVLVGAFALAFFWTPLATQGFTQKIFYVHVPMAIVTLCGFVAGGVYALRYLRSGDRSFDLKSYVAVHMSLILSIAVLVTGAIWGKAEWGKWWRWEEPTLVSFLIVFLLFACYQPLRFSIEDPDRQARYAAVFALIGGAFVPLNFAAVRQAEPDLHPRTFATADGGLPAEMMFTFLVALAGFILLFVTLFKFELTAKETRFKLKALKRKLAARTLAVESPRQGRSAAPQMLPTVSRVD